MGHRRGTDIHFPDVSIQYQKFRMVSADDIRARTALLFQQVDQSGGLHFTLTHSLSGVPVEFVRDFDITRFAVVNEAENTIVVRNVQYDSLPDDRKSVGGALVRYRKELGPDTLLHDDENGFILGKTLAELFLSRELGNLARRFVLFGAEKLRVYKVRAAHPKLKLRLGHGIDFLRGEASLEIEGEQFSLWDVMAQYAKHSYVTLSDGTHAVLNTDYLAKLGRLIKKQDKGVKVSFFDLPLVEELIEQTGAETPFPEAREVFLGFNSLARKRLGSPPINGTLRPYQMDGLKWLDYLHGHGLGGCLADDMGLGKTVQTISLLSRIYPTRKTPSLLVMPRSLLFNWQHEIRQFCPGLSFYVFHGANRDLDAAMRQHLVLTTYGMVRNHAEEIAKRRFHCVILDESQAIKNTNSQTTRAVLMLKAQCRLALSGTPMENDLGELYSLFRFLNPAMFGSAEQFNRDYAVPIHHHNDKDAARELRKKIYPFILRRLKRDVIKDLPEKIEQILYVDMSPDQQRFYETRRRFYYEVIKRRIAEDGLGKNQFFILEALMELRQIATIPEAETDGAIISPKRESLVESIADAVLNGHKAIVFTNFIAAIELVADDLQNRDIKYLTMTGATSNRETLVTQFQTDDSIKVFLMTLKTGGVGLNLAAADTVFIFDPWWNVAAELQAVDRTHRIGQDRTVFAYKLIARNSIEEKTIQLQQRKKELFDAVISSDGSGLKALTEEDLDTILG